MPYYCSALVVSYLLYISWITVFFSLPSSARFGNKPGDVKILKMLHFCSGIQSYAAFSFAFAMLATAPTFGSTPECNPNALVVLFRPFSALNAGRILFCVLVGLVCIAYTALLVNDHIVLRAKKMARILKQLIVQQIPAPDMSGEAAVPPPPPAPSKASEATATAPPAFKKYVPPSKHRVGPIHIG
jgi:ascorbate-specific PTS system EIIC-type component UlaA